MLVLDYKKEPFWLDLAGCFRVRVRPFNSMIHAAALDALDSALPDIPAQPDAPAAIQNRARWARQVIEVAKLVVIEWEGVVDDQNQPLKATKDRVEWVFDIPVIHQDFSEKYLVPGLIMGVEKKPFAPAPHGTLAGAQDTALDASTSTTGAAKGATIQ